MLTIFTPAYNRASLLPRLFESIQSQVAVGEDVEWLVIDDGSKDETPAVVQGFVAARPDLVRYERVENGGKHRAINRAAQLANGDWILIVDSDDMVCAGALESIIKLIASSAIDDSIGVLRGLRYFPGKIPALFKFDTPGNPGYHYEWVSHQKTFDTAEVVRKLALQAYPFSDHPGEKFQAEGWLWYSLDEAYKTLFVQQAWVECLYQADGLSSQSCTIRANSPCGAMDVYTKAINSPASVSERSKASINWWRYYFHAKVSGKYKLFEIKISSSRLFKPVGWCLFFRDHRSK